MTELRLFEEASEEAEEARRWYRERSESFSKIKFSTSSPLHTRSGVRAIGESVCTGNTAAHSLRQSAWAQESSNLAPSGSSSTSNSVGHDTCGHGCRSSIRCSSRLPCRSRRASPGPTVYSRQATESRDELHQRLVTQVRPLGYGSRRPRSADGLPPIYGVGCLIFLYILAKTTAYGGND